MQPLRISASSYSNTAPLIWSFLYGSQHGRVEIILDNAPARSAQLLEQDRVDTALVPVIAYQQIDGLRMIPDVCVGARRRVRSVALVTRGCELPDVKSVALDVSSKTSVVLTKIIFREFLGFEPEWRDAEPNVETMLASADAALLIGDPALSIPDCGTRNAESLSSSSAVDSTEIIDHTNSAFRVPRSAFEDSAIKKFDLAALWHQYTGLGFVFAMWMTRAERSPTDFAAARDEGLGHLDEIAANYSGEIGLSREEMMSYLSENISYSIDDPMQKGLKLYFDLAGKCGLIEAARSPRYLE
jgi:chorismate dehydratase